MKNLKLYFVLLFMAAHQISFSQNTKSKAIHVLWYDESKDSLIFNSEYFRLIPNNEKAAIAYIALYDSRNCEWDGEVNKSYSNLSCKIIKALGLGYQCSPQHLQILNHWFRNDTSILKEVKFCPMVPNTAHSVQGIDSVSLTRLANNEFKIFYSASGANISVMAYWSFSETITFKTGGDKLTVISRKKNKVSRGKFKE